MTPAQKTYLQSLKTLQFADLSANPENNVDEENSSSTSFNASVKLALGLSADCQFDEAATWNDLSFQNLGFSVSVCVGEFFAIGESFKNKKRSTVGLRQIIWHRNVNGVAVPI